MVHQLVQRRGGLGVARVRDHLAVHVDPVTGSAHRPVVELDGLVTHSGRRAGGARRDVARLELRAHDALPVGPPAHLPQLLEECLDSIRPDERDGPAVDKDAVEHERRQAEGVVTVEVGQEDDLDAARVDPEPVHVRQQRRSSIQEHTSIHHHGPVVAVERERRAAAEERELYAMVTAGLRYTSWIALSNSIPSFIGRWNDFRPLIRPIPPARLLMTAVRTASFRSVAPLLSPPELILPALPM